MAGRADERIGGEDFHLFQSHQVGGYFGEWKQLGVLMLKIPNGLIFHQLKLCYGICGDLGDGSVS